ncbi:MAG: hypothetical protein HDT47_03800 [Ruminococcaceae bacterium]|nr:hypothetical protein [Oscillospiraceae bacterium]
MKEYGGYLPLELQHGKAYYNFDNDKIIKTNSGLTAIYCALSAINPKKVYLPYFVCPTVDNLVSSMGFEIVQYNIDKDFQPINLNCSDEDCVLLVNYFGINTDMVIKNYSRFNNVIIDNTQAFFAEPIFRKNVFNVYSCRKFIGTSDGGYLIGTDLPEVNMEQDCSGKRASFLLMQYEYGTNEAYQDSIENYNQIRDERKRMSNLTERILESVDYTFVKDRRQRNFQELCKLLGGLNKLKLDLSDNDIPYTYPFMIRKDIRSKLVEHKIYVPWIWKEKNTDDYFGIPEYDFTKYIFHLPIDQRYSERDMDYIAQTVLNLLEEI